MNEEARDASVADNPFASLFTTRLPAPSLNEASTSKHLDASDQIIEVNQIGSTTDRDSPVEPSGAYEVNEFIQKVFLFTVAEDHRDYSTDTSPGNCLVLLTELKERLNVLGQTWIDLEHLNEAVFDRLLISDPKSVLCPVSGFYPSLAEFHLGQILSVLEGREFEQIE